MAGGSEDELLLLAARSGLAGGDAERLRTVARGEVDWRRLVRLASWHRVVALLHANLEPHCREWVPEGVLGELGEQRERNARRNLRLALELDNLLALFEARGIAGRSR